MREEVFDVEADQLVQDVDDFADFTSYEDGTGYVICDRTNPKAWISSDETQPLAP